MNFCSKLHVLSLSTALHFEMELYLATVEQTRYDAKTPFKDRAGSNKRTSQIYMSDQLDLKNKLKCSMSPSTYKKTHEGKVVEES